MRFEINVPDTTSRERKARLAKLTKSLSKHPEFIEEIPVDEDEAIQRMFTPEVIAELDRADAEIDAGNYLTTQQVKKQLSAHKAKWLRKNLA